MGLCSFLLFLLYPLKVAGGDVGGGYGGDALDGDYKAVVALDALDVTLGTLKDACCYNILLQLGVKYPLEELFYSVSHNNLCIVIARAERLVAISLIVFLVNLVSLVNLGIGASLNSLYSLFSLNSLSLAPKPFSYCKFSKNSPTIMQLSKIISKFVVQSSDCRHIRKCFSES